MNHLPMGCPASIPDPVRRKRALEDARLRLWSTIIDALDKVEVMTREIEECEIVINERRECDLI